MELKRAGEAVKLAQNTILAASVLIVFVQSIMSLFSFESIDSVGYLTVPVLLSIVYGMMGFLVLQSVSTGLKLRMIEYSEPSGKKI